VAPQDRWLRALWRRRRRPFLSAAALLLIAVFLLWGPIGLGNGPLGVPAMDGHFGSVDATSQPMVYVASLVNAGRSAAVIDGVTVISEPAASAASTTAR
jgi:hypothetical protein